tara:strand:+ start:988 stop:1101 length:114 start_codon:yes stop_codon:yes gene_type:complete
VQVLELYSAEADAGDQYETEHSCIVTLANDAVFPAGA